jgi:hypothetical protein
VLRPKLKSLASSSATSKSWTAIAETNHDAKNNDPSLNGASAMDGAGGDDSYASVAFTKAAELVQDDIQCTMYKNDLSAMVGFWNGVQKKQLKYNKDFQTIMEMSDSGGPDQSRLATVAGSTSLSSLQSVVAFIDNNISKTLPDWYIELAVKMKYQIELSRISIPTAVFSSIDDIDAFLGIRSMFFTMVFARMLTDGAWENTPLGFPTATFPNTLKMQCLNDGLTALYVRWAQV